MLKLNNLRPWEEVSLVLKRHWIVYIYIFLYAKIALLLSWGIFAFFWDSAFVVIFNTIFLMIASLFVYIQWLNYELDIFIITNNRVIWVEQISFLNRTVSEANLGQVQEVNSQTKWVMANILDYWTILIQTAWNATNFEMTYAPNAIQNARVILNIVDTYRDAHSARTPEVPAPKEEKTPPMN